MGASQPVTVRPAENRYHGEISLCPVAAPDAPFIQQLLEDMAPLSVTNLPPVIAANAGQRYVELAAGGWRERHWAPFIINQGGGALGLLVVEPDALCAEGEWNLFYYIWPEHWGRGVATKAVIKCLELAFDEIGLRSVCARCQSDHLASLRVLGKAGFHEVGRVTNDGTFGARTMGQEVLLLRCLNPSAPAE